MSGKSVRQMSRPLILDVFEPHFQSSDNFYLTEAVVKTNVPLNEGGGQKSRVDSILASGPSCPGSWTQLPRVLDPAAPGFNHGSGHFSGEKFLMLLG